MYLIKKETFQNKSGQDFQHDDLGNEQITNDQKLFESQIEESQSNVSNLSVQKLNKNIQMIQKNYILEIQTFSKQFSEALNNLKDLEILLSKIKNVRKIKLFMTVQFKDSQGRLNFSQNLLKLSHSTPFIQQISLRISGNISKQQQKKLIESLKVFVLLSSLELNYDQSILDNEVAEGISSQISHIQTLKTLKIFAKLDDFISQKLSRKSIIDINNACYKLLSLEVFQFPFLLERNNQKISGLISNFLHYRVSNSYHYSLQVFLPFQMDNFNKFKQQLQSKRNKITSVTFHEYQYFKYHNDFQRIKFIDYLSRLVMIYDLPYLTYFSTNFTLAYMKNHQAKQSIDDSIKHIQSLISERIVSLIQFIAFEKFICPPLKVNPYLVFLDLYID